MHVMKTSVYTCLCMGKMNCYRENGSAYAINPAFTTNV